MTAVERAVRSYLKQEMRSGMNLHRTWPDYAYRNRHDLLMQHGRTFAPQPRPKGYRQRAMGLCFRNSVSLAISRRLRYAEGVAMHPKMPMLVHHAWCLDAHDRVVDVTWDLPGVVYFGIIVPVSIVSRSGGCVLDNWEDHWPACRKPWRY